MTTLKSLWYILTGKMKTHETVYVRESKPPNQFVQLINWRDSILALDAEGKIWEIKECGNLAGYPLGLQLIMESPRSYR